VARYFDDDAIIVLCATRLCLLLKDNMIGADYSGIFSEVKVKDESTRLADTFRSLNSFSFSELWVDHDQAAVPSCMNVCDGDKLIIGFSDGRVRVLLCADKLRSDRKPTTIFDFLSNSRPYDGTFGVASLSICPWKIFSESYAFEMTSLSESGVIAHWRLQVQRKDFPENPAALDDVFRYHQKHKKSQFLGYAHLLGVSKFM
jgi:hypothetical protein